jgi:hypothetical protein
MTSVGPCRLHGGTADEPRTVDWSEQTMTATVVRYRVKPDRADENQRLIEAVFAELAEREPEGFTYRCSDSTTG